MRLPPLRLPHASIFSVSEAMGFPRPRRLAVADSPLATKYIQLNMSGTDDPKNKPGSLVSFPDAFEAIDLGILFDMTNPNTSTSQLT